MMYEAFTIHLECATLHTLAAMIREGVEGVPPALPLPPVVKAELQNLACEIEARLQKVAQYKITPKTTTPENWLL